MGILAGAREGEWSSSLVLSVDSFCSKYNGIVIYSNLSNYSGNCGILKSFAEENKDLLHLDLLICLDEDIYTNIEVDEVWRVDSQGKLSATHNHLKYVFEMSDEAFFEYYNNCKNFANRDSFSELKDKFQNQVISKLENRNYQFSDENVLRRLSKNMKRQTRVYIGDHDLELIWEKIALPKGVLSFSYPNGGSLSVVLGASKVYSNSTYLIIEQSIFLTEFSAILDNKLTGSVMIVVFNFTGYKSDSLRKASELMGINYACVSDINSLDSVIKTFSVTQSPILCELLF